MKLTFTFPGKKGFDGDLPSPPADRRFVALPLPRLTGSSPDPRPVALEEGVFGSPSLDPHSSPRR